MADKAYINHKQMWWENLVGTFLVVHPKNSMKFEVVWIFDGDGKPSRHLS